MINVLLYFSSVSFFFLFLYDIGFRREYPDVKFTVARIVFASYSQRNSILMAVNFNEKN